MSQGKWRRQEKDLSTCHATRPMVDPDNEMVQSFPVPLCQQYVAQTFPTLVPFSSEDISNERHSTRTFREFRAYPIFAGKLNFLPKQVT